MTKTPTKKTTHKPKPTPREAPGRLSAEEEKERREKGLEMLRAGKPQAEVARELKVSRAAVSLWNKDAGGISTPKSVRGRKIAPNIILQPISERITLPEPEEIRRVREECGLTQTQACNMVLTGNRYRNWGGYETPDKSSPYYHEIHPAAWELFLLLTDRHPTLKLSKRRKGEKKTRK